MRDAHLFDTSAGGVWRRARDLCLALAIAALSIIAASRAAADEYRAPRTPWGAPQLEGLWTNASYTQLERPKELSGLVIDEAGALAWAARLAEHGGVPIQNDEVGQSESEYFETGDRLARMRGEYRTSWIVSPPDGKLPYTPEARAALQARMTSPQRFDNPETAPPWERCLISSGTMPPMLSMVDNNLYQIVQTADHVVFVAERLHDVRVIRIGANRDPQTPASLSGDSIGRWEGETLVVETEGFQWKTIDRRYLSNSGSAKVTERFTRVADGEVLYEFVVTDPAMFTQPWRGEMQFRTTQGPMYEFACHEGNYSLTHVLQGARARDRKRSPPRGDTAR